MEGKEKNTGGDGIKRVKISRSKYEIPPFLLNRDNTSFYHTKDT